MRKRPGYPIAIRTSRFAVTVLLATVCAGCSSNLARFDGDPFSNPFINRNDSIATGSVRPAQQRLSHAQQPYRQPSPAVGRVSAAPLPAPGTSAIGQLKVRPATPVSVTQTQRSAAAKAAQPIHTGTIAAKAAPGWSTKGGTPITLKQGETVETVANRYGVPASVILHVNGMSSSSQAVPGKLLIIPTYSATLRHGEEADAGLAQKAAALIPALQADRPFLKAGAHLHLAFNGETSDAPGAELIDNTALLAFTSEPGARAPAPKKVRSVANIAAPISIKPPLAVTQPAPVKAAAKPVTVKAAATKPATPSKVAVKAPAKPAASKVVAQPARILAAAPARHPTAKPVVAAAKPQKAAQPVKSAKVDTKPKAIASVPAKTTSPVASAKPAAKHAVMASAVKKVPAVAVKAPAKPVAVASVAPKPAKPEVQPSEISAYAADTTATGSLPPAAIPPGDNGVFRWPARGRIISSFGSKDISGTNNGINISMPEGTPVKAAEAGTVAYSGDDVKKYGKLVLIKHDNGYVSAYAHNGELDVKKGETVKRGQIIAKSGATGDVTSPQLHFQLRKGELPVDPIKLLDAN
ncbi:MAG: peptidoglycan DD-metalloendopeptidase family protein [Beijerinckiaceae bacterium]|nr:peptidoglycan DD-metalloendopeptidase family protein [Beijerinckiaceae bacterium]